MSTWEERMSRRAKARMLLAQAEAITRDPVPEPPRCVDCGALVDCGAVFSPHGGPWCLTCEDTRAAGMPRP